MIVRRLENWTEVHVTFLIVSELRRKILQLRLPEVVTNRPAYFIPVAASPIKVES
jgi:hypothetical protein